MTSIDSATRVDRPSGLQLDLADLAGRLRGEVVRGDQPDYLQLSKLASSRHVRRPLAFARCTGVADVRETVLFARENDVPFTVLAGGHDADGWGLRDDTLTIDLRPMNTVHVDARTRRGVVQAGCRLGIMDRETAVHGLAVTGGTVSDTGVAGLTLGGGVGWLTRKFGATIDSLVGIDAVTADGDVVHASADENPELFWGMRGGGGNFAVATAFTFALHEQNPTILAGSLVHRGADAVSFLQRYRELMLDAPDELGAMALLMRAAGPNYPAELAGQPVVSTIFAWAGDRAEGERILAPIRHFGSPVSDSIRPQRYTTLQQVFESPLLPQNQRRYQNSGFLPEMTDAFIGEAVDLIEHSPVPRNGEHNVVILPISAMGGAFLRADEQSAAMPRGNATFYWEAASSHAFAPDDDDWIGYVRETMQPRLRAHSGPQAYLNHNSVAPDDHAFIRWAFGDAKYDRLVRLKDEWDPQNTLRFTKNIPPSRAR